MDVVSSLPGFLIEIFDFDLEWFSNRFFHPGCRPASSGTNELH